MAPDPAKTEVAVVDAATALFLERGLDAVTVDDIAEAAGVSRRTVFNRFGGKEAVLEAVFAHHWETYHRSVLEIRDAADGDVARTLQRIGRSIVEFNTATRQADFARLLIAEGAHYPELVARFFEQGRGRFLRLFEAWISRQVQARRLSCPNAELAALQFLGCIQEPLVWPLVTRVPRPAVDADEVIDSAVATFIARYALAARLRRRERGVPPAIAGARPEHNSKKARLPPTDRTSGSAWLWQPCRYSDMAATTTGTWQAAPG